MRPWLKRLLSSALLGQVTHELITVSLGASNAYVSVENSGNAAVRDVKFIGCKFMGLHALQVIGGIGIELRSIAILDSQVSSNHVIRVTGVIILSLRDVLVRNLTGPDAFLGNLRVVKIDALPNLGPRSVNHINITNFTYISSQVSFFDF